MASSLGPFNFLRSAGVPQPLSRQKEVVTRTGANGVAVKKKGVTAVSFRWRTWIDILNDAEAQSIIESYKAAVDGPLVSMTDSANRTWDNIEILGVQEVRIQPVGTFVGGFNSDPKYLMEVEWTLQNTEVPP